MSHFISVIFLIVIAVILYYLIPKGMLLGASVVLVLSVLTIQTSAYLVTHKKVPFSSALKALLLSVVFIAAAAFLGAKLVVGTSAAALVLVPVFMLLAQMLAFSVTLDVTLVASALVSICVTVVSWAAAMVFGATFSGVLRVLH